MKELGFDPRSPEDWRRYAIVLYRDHRLIAGMVPTTRKHLWSANAPMMLTVVTPLWSGCWRLSCDISTRPFGA